jgi:hypothetical protein
LQIFHNGKPAHLVFHADTIQKTNVEDSILVKIDPPHFSKALPSKIDYERLSPYFAYRPHDIVQHTLRQTTQLAKSTIHYLADQWTELHSPWQNPAELNGVKYLKPHAQVLLDMDRNGAPDKG